MDLEYTKQQLNATIRNIMSHIEFRLKPSLSELPEILNSAYKSGDKVKKLETLRSILVRIYYSISDWMQWLGNPVIVVQLSDDEINTLLSKFYEILHTILNIDLEHCERMIKTLKQNMEDKETLNILTLIYDVVGRERRQCPHQQQYHI